MLTKELKILLLTKLNDHKVALQEKFQSASDGKRRKEEIWQKIWESMRARGYTSSLATLRDTEYQNIRRSTMNKADNCTKTGASADGKFNEVDLLLIQFVGKDSPGLKGLHVKESTVRGFVEEHHPKHEETADNAEVNDVMIEAAEDTCQEVAACTSAAANVDNTDTSTNPQSMIQTPKKRKTKEELICENLRLQNKKLRLEIMQLQYNLKSSGAPWEEILISDD